jgi:hypothetical protein
MDRYLRSCLNPERNDTTECPGNGGESKPVGHLRSSRNDTNISRIRAVPDGLAHAQPHLFLRIP